MALTNQQYSYVVGAFQIAYTIMQPIAGYVLDAIGTRGGFALFAIGWSISNMLHAFAATWPMLAACRGLLGMTEAAVIPGGLKVVSEWFPPRERTIATGWFNIGSSIGAMLAPPLVVFCIYRWGLQSAFFVTGGVGLFWAGLWYWGYRSPADHPYISAAELRYIEAGRDAESSHSRARWQSILRTRKFWSIAIPRFLADPAWHTFNFWIPLYLVSTRGMDLKSVAAFAWLPFLAADFGSVAGGYLAPWLIRKFNVSLLTSRKIVMTVGTLLMAGPACIGLADTAYEAIALFCVGGFAHQMLSGALLTLSADLFKPNEVATASGMAGSAAWIGGLSFSLLIGAAAERIGYHPLFVGMASLDVIGAVVLWTMLRGLAAERA